MTLVDRIRERLGLRVICHDESGFGSREDIESENCSADDFPRDDRPGHYDPRRLAEDVVEVNQLHAAFVGALSDAMRSAGIQTQSAIGQFSNFEQLEFRGREKAANIDALLEELRMIIDKHGGGDAEDDV